METKMGRISDFLHKKKKKQMNIDYHSYKDITQYG